MGFSLSSTDTAWLHRKLKKHESAFLWHLNHHQLPTVLHFQESNCRQFQQDRANQCKQSVTDYACLQVSCKLTLSIKLRILHRSSHPIACEFAACENTWKQEISFSKGYLKNVLYISVPCTSEKNAMSGPETRSAVQNRSALALRNVSFPRIESRQALDWRTPDLMGSSVERTAVLKFDGSSTPAQRNHDQNKIRRKSRYNALWSTIDDTSSRVRSKTKKKTRKQEDVKQ
jgi:hypothetical protein